MMPRRVMASTAAVELSRFEAETWNREHPSGTDVDVTMEDGSIRPTKTRSQAFVLGTHTASVWVIGVIGPCLLSRVKPRVK